MNNKLSGLVVSVLMSLSMSIPVFASDDNLTRARVGISNNSFSSLYSGGDLDADFSSLNVGVTYITSDALYYDLAYKQNLGGSWETEQNGFVFGDDYNRTDLTLTIGKVLDSGIQLFAGYQDSDTDIAGQWESGEDEGFDVKGFFIGAGKSFKVNEGSLNLNAALGTMDAVLVDGSARSHDSTSGSGYSIGATYTMFLSEGMSANFEFKQQKYDYEFGTGPNTGGDDKMTMFGVNLVRSL